MAQALLIVAAIWVVCGLASAGITYAYFWGKYPTVRNHRSDLTYAICLGLFGGPVSLCVAYFYSGRCKYGWRLCE